MSSRLRAFTIVELMVTISIISLLIATAAIGVNKARKNARDGQRVSDVVSIGSAVNLSVTVNAGKYPYSLSNRNQSTFCADDLGNATSNPNNLDFTLFRSRAIPKDPIPEQFSGTCTSYVNGYTFHNRYGSGSALIKSTTTENWEYAIEVGLENIPTSEDQTLQKGSLSDSVRSQYIFYGKYCGVGSANNCI
jgi:prepilin-type N-terminal cleavage/methylation domain-containing protein